MYVHLNFPSVAHSFSRHVTLMALSLCRVCLLCEMGFQSHETAADATHVNNSDIWKTVTPVPGRLEPNFY